MNTRPKDTRWRCPPPARSASALLLVMLAVGACTPDPETVERAGVDPVGMYELELVDDNERIPGTMEIAGTAGSYTGHIRAEGRPDGTISTVTTGGDQVTITADFPGMVLLLRLDFDGDSFVGDWSMRAQGGSVEGRRTAS